jgi:hypothetical protein
VIVFVKAEVFNKDQSPISLTLDRREPYFRDHAPAQPQKIWRESETNSGPLGRFSLFLRVQRRG